MKITENIGFIGGGQMAEALIKGIIQAGLVKAEQIYVVDPVEERCDFLRDQYGINVSARSDSVLKAEIIILAVKPQIMETVLADIRDKVGQGHLFISIAAGITLAFLEKGLAGTDSRVVRVMPNTPALVLAGASGISPGKHAAAADMRIAGGIFDAIGQSVVMAESYLDAVTGLSGSGPAYVFSFIEALVDAGLKVGLPRNDAETLALQTVYGSVKLAMEKREHPASLRAMVTSPGGTTIAGLHKLEKAGFQGIIMDAVEAATIRSRELGKLL